MSRLCRKDCLSCIEHKSNAGLDFTSKFSYKQVMVSLSSQNVSDMTDILFQAAEADCMDDLRRRVVDLVHDSFQSTSTIFWLIDEDNIMIDPVMCDIQDQFLLPYKSYFFKQNPFDPINIHLKDRPSVLMEQIIPQAEFHRTEYYNDFLKRQNIHRQMAVYIRQGDRLKGVLGMHRSKKENFGKNFLFMGDMIAGALSAVFEKLALKQEMDKTRGFLSMLQTDTTHGIIILDENLNCLFSNSKADHTCARLAEKYAPARIPGNTGRRIPEIIVENCRKKTAFPLLFRQRKLSRGPEESFRVKCRSVDKKISGTGKDLFMVTIEEDDPGNRISHARLKERFGLTRREIEIVSYISRGFTNLEIADTLFISEGTVKNHLKHIFSKTRATNRTQIIHKALFSDTMP